MCQAVITGEGGFLAGTPGGCTRQALQLQRHKGLQGLTWLPSWPGQSHSVDGLGTGPWGLPKALQGGVWGG